MASGGIEGLLASVQVARSAAKVVSGVAFSNAREARCLWVGTAGTATIVTAGGDTLTNFPLKEGGNPIACTQVTLGTASDVWGLF